MKIVVIGAGISGCVCAYLLSKAGHKVTLIEKGRGVGGRMSTRRMNGARIDHGAQFFTVRDSRMEKLLELWKLRGVVIPWYDRIAGRPDLPRNVRYRGVSGMTGPAKILSEIFSFEKEFFVESIYFNQGWQVNERGGENRILSADHLVLTMPAPQIVELFTRSQFELDSEVMDKLNGVKYTRCLALLATLDQASCLSSPGTVTHPVSEIDWISDNQIKGISDFPACTVHASNAYSQKFWDKSDNDRCPFLIKTAEEILNAKITDWSCHRWGFAKPLVTFGANQFTSSQNCISLAGDSFGGERIENAAMSGWDAATTINEIYSS